MDLTEGALSPTVFKGLTCFLIVVDSWRQCFIILTKEKLVGNTRFIGYLHTNKVKIAIASITFKLFNIL